MYGRMFQNWIDYIEENYDTICKNKDDFGITQLKHRVLI